MGQKDLAAKQFESSPEVFADIINAFIFEGEQVVSPKDLQPAPTESLYPTAHGILRNQYNDVSKYEIRNVRREEEELRCVKWWINLCREEESRE